MLVKTNCSTYPVVILTLLLLEVEVCLFYEYFFIILLKGSFIFINSNETVAFQNLNFSNLNNIGGGNIQSILVYDNTSGSVWEKKIFFYFILFFLG
jgi:hypothetical protein